MNQRTLRFPEGKTKAFTLSYDDAVEQDIKLVELMKKYKIKGTFNVNSGCYPDGETEYPKWHTNKRMTEKMCTDLYSDPFIEVAVHGLTHPFFDRLTPAMMMEQVLRDRINLEKQFGKIIRGMAFPYGTYDDRVIEIIKMAGIVYSRTIESHHTFNLPDDWHRLGTTCHHNDPKLMELADKFLHDPACTHHYYRQPYLFSIWGHSYEFDTDHNWNVIEALFEKVSGHEDVWYASNIEIYDYIQAFNRLIFSVDGKHIYNPSALTVWCQCDDEVIEIAAGKDKYDGDKE